MEKQSESPDGTPESRVDQSPDDLGPLGQVIRQIRERLQLGGPKVDYAALYAYLDADLPEPQRQEVELRIARWSAWHDAYWQIRADLDLLEASGADEGLGSTVGTGTSTSLPGSAGEGA
jgi:hypothetical protein